MKIKDISTNKAIVQNGSTEDKLISPGTKMILMRYLSQNERLPGNGQWQLVTSRQVPCWINEREMKGYIFWTLDMEQKSSKNL